MCNVCKLYLLSGRVFILFMHSEMVVLSSKCYLP